jgi:hypothetical protein
MHATGRRVLGAAAGTPDEVTLPMARHDPHRAELNALAAGLVRPAAGRSNDDTAAASGHHPDPNRGLEIEALIRELQSKLSDAADATEEIVSVHPLVAVASAFMLGIVIGRMMGRR